MHNKIIMQILETSENLNHYTLDLWFRKWSLHMIQQACQILLTILHNQEYAEKQIEGKIYNDTL